METVDILKRIYNLQQLILPIMLVCVVITMIMSIMIYNKLTEKPETSLDKVKKAINKVKTVKKGNK